MSFSSIPYIRKCRKTKWYLHPHMQLLHFIPTIKPSFWWLAVWYSKLFYYTFHTFFISFHLLLNLTFHTSVHTTKHLRQGISNAKRDYVDIIFINEIKYYYLAFGSSSLSRIFRCRLRPWMFPALILKLWGPWFWSFSFWTEKRPDILLIKNNNLVSNTQNGLVDRENQGWPVVNFWLCYLYICCVILMSPGLTRRDAPFIGQTILVFSSPSGSYCWHLPPSSNWGTLSFGALE